MKEFLGKLRAVWARALKKVCQPHPRLKVKRNWFDGGTKLLTCRRHQLSCAGPAEECKEHMVWFWIVKNRGIWRPWLIHVVKLIRLCHLVCLECTGVWKNADWSSLSLEELRNTLKHFHWTSWFMCWRLLCDAKCQCVYSTRLMMMDSKPVRHM
jgi:hypothetical protein